MEIFDHNQLHMKDPYPPPQRKGSARLLWVVCCAVLAAALVAVSVMLILATARKKTENAPDYAQVFASVRGSVCCVETDNKSGSGVVYRLRGGETYVITNRHVVEENTTVQLSFGEYTQPVEGTVLGYDEYHDIALIKATGSFGTPVVLGSAAAGDRLLAVGNNLGAGIAAYEGILSRADRMLTVSGKKVPVMAVTCALNAGMSGGGVFGADGKIVGIGTYQTIDALENGQSRPVYDTSYCVPYEIAARVADAIFASEEGGQVRRLTLTADPNIDDCLVFDDLYFSARRSHEGYKIDGIRYVSLPAVMNAPLEEGDLIERFGGIAVSAQTEYRALFAELLRYTREQTGKAPFTLTVRRGDRRITVEYGYCER